MFAACALGVLNTLKENDEAKFLKIKTEELKLLLFWLLLGIRSFSCRAQCTSRHFKIMSTCCVGDSLFNEGQKVEIKTEGAKSD